MPDTKTSGLATAVPISGDKRYFTQTVGGPTDKAEVLAGTIMLSAPGGLPSLTSGCVVATQVETATNKVNTAPLTFGDTNGKLYAEWGVFMPPSYGGGTVTAKFVWFAPSTSTNGVQWGLQAVAFPNLSTLDTAYGAAQEVNQTHSSTANQVQITGSTAAITIAGSPAAGVWVQFRAYRDSANAGDTLAQTVSLLAVVVTF